MGWWNGCKWLSFSLSSCFSHAECETTLSNIPNSHNKGTTTNNNQFTTTNLAAACCQPNTPQFSSIHTNFPFVNSKQSHQRVFESELLLVMIPMG